MPIEPALAASEGRMPRASCHGATGRQDAGRERPARWRGPHPEPARARPPEPARRRSLGPAKRFFLWPAKRDLGFGVAPGGVARAAPSRPFQARDSPGPAQAGAAAAHARDPALFGGRDRRAALRSAAGQRTVAGDPPAVSTAARGPLPRPRLPVLRARPGARPHDPLDDLDARRHRQGGPDARRPDRLAAAALSPPVHGRRSTPRRRSGLAPGPIGCR